MRFIVDILTPARSELLTTLARVKGELKIKSKDDDEVLLAKIAEASSDIQGAMGYRLPSEDVRVTFWHDDVSAVPGSSLGSLAVRNPAETTLFLPRTPVSAIASVTVDDTLVDPSEYRLDSGAGLLDRLDSNGYPCAWRFCKSVIVQCTAGFILPGQPSRNLEYAIEGAVVALVSDYWAARGRDPRVRREVLPGVIERDYWVGAVGDPGLLPPRILQSIEQFRRLSYAVA